MPGSLDTNCTTGEVESAPLSAEEQTAYNTRAGQPNDITIRRADWEAFRAQLVAEADWLQGKVDNAPAPNTTTSGNAVARLDDLIQHVKKVDRGLIRLARNIAEGVLDSDP